MSAEDVKVASHYLGGTIGDELANDRTDFEHDAELLLKFHGIYQQDDRDVRRVRTQQKLPLDYSCMVRASVPGGVISPEQWLALDRVAELADQKLRLTTRQGVQFHVVHKTELRELVAGINASLLTTLAACGDVVRNVMACPLPDPARQAVLEPVVAEMVARFRPRTETYWELWVDGEQAVTAEPSPAAQHPERPSAHARPEAITPIDEVEPVYGEAYLPRKFKIGIAWPGDNCIDVYSNDVGIVPTLTEGTTGELTGFVVLAGGGMGMTHNRPDDTYPLLARPVAWVPPADLGDVVEAIITTQRDHGNRDDRNRARLKYLLEERGIDWLRDADRGRAPGSRWRRRSRCREFRDDAHFHWHEIDGVDTLGLPVPSGKVVGGYPRRAPRTRRRRARVANSGSPHARTCSSSVPAIAPRSSRSSTSTASRSPATRRRSAACRSPASALPTCSKALGEAERVLPDVVDDLEKLLADTGNTGLPLRVNMTGCPNGCARPYGAELGIVGRTKKNYDIYVGGNEQGDRLAELLRADVPLTDVPSCCAPSSNASPPTACRSTRPAGRFATNFRMGRWGSGTGARRTTWPSCRRCCRRRPAGAAAQRAAADDATPSDRDMTVWLVGAGPGDPDLLTVKAARLIADGRRDRARCARRRRRAGPRAGRRRTDRRRQATRAAPSPQDVISALLVELGRAGQARRAPEGRRPVRVRPRRRGGPRPARGRASTSRSCPASRSSIAAPMAAGIPVTHRGVSAAFTVVTGHRRAGEHDIDWRSLANVGGTIVILMGVSQRASIAAELIAGGLDPHDPGRGDPLGHHRRADGASAASSANSATRRSSRRASSSSGPVAAFDLRSIA